VRIIHGRWTRQHISSPNLRVVGRRPASPYMCTSVDGRGRTRLDCQAFDNAMDRWQFDTSIFATVRTLCLYVYIFYYTLFDGRLKGFKPNVRRLIPLFQRRQKRGRVCGVAHVPLDHTTVPPGWRSVRLVVIVSSLFRC
jgi:hypothetical protein